MHKTVALLAALTVALTGCSGGGDDEAGPEPSPSSSFPIATVLLDNGEESTLVTVEVAETEEQQAEALPGLDSLPGDEGMAFVFFEERDAGLHTTGTTIPFSIAFFDATGTIVEILDTEPCADDCPSYAPERPYMGALAVNRGSFEEWDIAEGDHVQLTR